MNPLQQQPDQQESLRRLRAVTRRIEAFFNAQMERLTSAMRQVQNMQSEYESARRLAMDLQQQQATWLSARDCEMRRLEHANEALANSWNELDQQRRELAIASMQSRPPENHNSLSASGESSAAVPQPRAVKKAVVSEMDLFVMKQLQAQVKQHQRRKR